MTQMQDGDTGARQRRLQRISRKAFFRGIVACVVIGSGVVVLKGVEKAFGLHFNKTPMPLREPLATIPKQLGERLSAKIPHRYVAMGEDQAMPEEEVEVLGTRYYLLRTYVDLSKDVNSLTRVLNVNLNYYPTGSATPHVPEVCWAGNGMVEANGSRRIFAIPNVVRADGRVETLRMRMISFWAPGVHDMKRLRNVAYMFHVNGDYVATPEEVASRFWKASNKYAYHCKIEVSVGDDGKAGMDGQVYGGHYCSQAEAQAAISDFIRAALPAIERCLPDPRVNDPGFKATKAGETAEPQMQQGY